jgi:catechol 2,3-dioxygenase-like lactoylglutathione lyase family enzyme
VTAPTRAQRVKTLADVTPSEHHVGMLSIGSVVLTVEDIERAGAFWRSALGYVNRREPSDDWVILDPPSKAHWAQPGASLALSVTGYPQHYPPRIHLDLYAEDQRAEVERLLGLGAREVDWDNYPDDADWVVLEDTEGNRFCVVDAGPRPTD